MVVDMNRRLRRLEQVRAPASDGIAACSACENGTKKTTQVFFEGNPEPEPLNCAMCGRNLAFQINMYHAKPPTRPAAETPA